MTERTAKRFQWAGVGLMKLWMLVVVALGAYTYLSAAARAFL